MSETRDSVTFYINGEKKTVKGQEIFQPLSSYLRYQNQLTGTKVVCAEGDCGACTIMMAKWSPNQKRNQYFSINSCIAMTFAMDGASLITVEGLSENNQCSEVQDSMVRNFSSQCGFCTPGFVMSLTNLFEQKHDPNVPLTSQTVKNYLTGNLCRCTGYSSIIQAAQDVNLKKHSYLKDRFPQKDLSDQLQKPVLIETPECQFYAPVTISEACRYKSENPQTIIFSGATDLGVQLNKGKLEPKKILSLHLIPELYTQKIENEMVTIGAKVSISETQKLVKDQIPQMDEFLGIFASPQIKNSATLVGNIANASPIADSVPMLMALDTEVIIVGHNSQSVKPIKDLYLGYKKLNLKPDEIITAIRFKIPSKEHKFQNYKISQRRDLDISTVNASFNFKMKDKVIESACVVYGGVAATTLRLTDLENQMVGQELNKNSLEKFKSEILKSITPLSDVRGSSEYRKILAVNLFEKFVRESLGL